MCRATAGKDASVIVEKVELNRERGWRVNGNRRSERGCLLGG